MSGIRFEWDRRKAESNVRKHGVTFEDAQTAFLDEHGLLIADPDRSNDEERFILLGELAPARLRVVCHCYRTSADVMRLIWARRATRKEKAVYREGAPHES